MIADENLKLYSGAMPANNTATNVVDGDVIRNLGVGTPLYVRVVYNTAVRANADGSGLTFYIVYADDAALTSNPRYMSVTNVFFGTTTGPSAGDVLYIPIPPVVNYAQNGQRFESGTAAFNAKKYIGVLISGYTWATATGNITIDIVTDVNRVENIYAGGFAVT
jgi:hypothetical protein